MTRSALAMLAALAAFPAVSAAQPNLPPLPEAIENQTGFASPAAALSALRSRPDVKFQKQANWLVAVDAANQAVWSFSPQDHAAYPDAIKRFVVKGAGGAFYVNTAIQCGGTKMVCDQLVRDFQKLNSDMAKH